MPNEVTEALTEMMSLFYQSVSEARVAAYTRKLKDYPVPIVKRACVRGTESKDSCPSLAYLIAVCREIQQEQHQRTGDDGQRADWIDEALNQGRVWYTGKEFQRQQWSPDERSRWRSWMLARVLEGWTENEASMVALGSRPIGWVPPVSLDARAENAVAFDELMQARTIGQRGRALSKVAGSLFKSVDAVLERGRAGTAA
jgi:hypothetical protein